MRRHSVLAALGVAALAVASAGAQEPRSLRLSGSVRGGYWSSTRNLDREHPLGAAMTWLEGTATLGAGVTAFAEGWGALRGPAEDGDAIARGFDGGLDNGAFFVGVEGLVFAQGAADDQAGDAGVEEGLEVGADGGEVEGLVLFELRGDGGENAGPVGVH